MKQCFRYLSLFVICFASTLFLGNGSQLHASGLDSKVVVSDTTEKVYQLQEAVVLANRYSGKGSMLTYTPKQAAATISVIGEPDVLRHISSLPGVSQGIEGTLGLFVRGGNNGSNGLYLNDLPLYISSHLLGMVSAYPAEIVNNATFYKGGFSAACGNQSSSVLDVETKHSTSADFNGSFTLSPYMSGLYAKVPIVNNKLALQVSARTTFLPYLYNTVSKSEDFKLDVHVYDVTAVLDFQPTDRHLIDAMFFTMNDYMRVQYPYTHTTMSSGSLNYKFGWLYRITDDLNLKFTAYSVDANLSQQQANTKTEELDSKVKSKLSIGSSMKEDAAKLSFFYQCLDNLNFNLGAVCQNQKFVPSSSEYYSMSHRQEVSNLDPSLLTSLFGDVDFSWPSRFDLKLGYRHTFQKYNTKNTSNFDIHLLSHIYLKDCLGIEATVDRMNQYYHQVEGLPTGWSMNIMLPADGDYPPELTQQAYAGFFWNPSSDFARINLSLGGYYRQMDNLMMYKTSINAFGLESASFKEEIDCGKGRSYGMEFAASIEADRFGGSLSYSLSKSDRVFPNINSGEPFPFKFDRRHILNFEGWYNFAKYLKRNGARTNHQINTAVSYSTGHHATLTTGYYQGIEPPYMNYSSIDYSTSLELLTQIYYRQLMSGKNEFIMKDYFRVDVAYTYTHIGKRCTNELALSVFNVLNRHNPYMIFPSNGRWKQLSIMPIMPSVRWTLRW